jgi:hypothetical protein
MRPRDPQPLFVRTAEYPSATQIDTRRKEMSSRNDRQFDVRLSAFVPGTSRQRYRTKTARTLDGDYGKLVKIYTWTDRRWETK